MASSSVGVKSYTESKSLLQYEGKVELGEEQESSFGSGAKKKQLPPIESNPCIKETLYSMFLPRKRKEIHSVCFLRTCYQRKGQGSF